MEIALVASVYVVYSYIRSSISGREVEALSRGLEIVAFERTLGIYHEQSLQGWLLNFPSLIEVFNFVYSALHLPPLIALALWSYNVNRRKYSLLRTAFLLSAGLGLVLFWLFPTAPPRLLPGQFGFIDTLAQYGPFNMYQPQSSTLINHYAAVPSLHFAWATLVAVGFAWLVNWRWYGLIVAALWPALILLTIVVTANHYLLDAFLGLAVVAGSLLFAMPLWKYLDDHFCRRLILRSCQRCAHG